MMFRWLLRSVVSQRPVAWIALVLAGVVGVDTAAARTQTTDRAEKLLRDADWAQRHGRCSQFDRAMDALRTMTRSARRSKRNINLADELIQTLSGAGNDPYEVFNDSSKLGPGNAEEFERLLREGCPAKTANGLAVEASGGVAVFRFPVQGFLGKELQGSGIAQLGAVTPDRSETGTTAGVAWSYTPFDPNTATVGKKRAGTAPTFRIGFDYSSVNSNQNLGSFDPGMNFRTLFPGPLGGPSGFSLGGNPANIVTDMFYHRDYSQHTGFFEYRSSRWQLLKDRNISSGNGLGGTTIQPYIRIVYGEGNLEESLTGRVAGFLSDFSYQTNVDVTSVGGVIGFDGRTPLFTIPGAPSVTGFRLSDATTEDGVWEAALRYAGEFGAFRVAASGTDTLNFNGFINANSTQQLDASATKPYYKLSGGVEMTSQEGAATAFFLFGFEQQPGYPVTVRDGTNPSRFDFEPVRIRSVRFGVRLRF